MPRGRHRKTSTKSTTGIKYHWHVNRSSFPHPNVQIVRFNTIETQIELVTTMSRLPINYHCHQSVVVEMVQGEQLPSLTMVLEGRSGTSSDIVHLAVVKRATNHRWYGEYQAGLITVCIQWPCCWWATTQQLNCHTKVILTKSYLWVFERSKD